MSFYIDQIQDYLEDLCMRHVEIKHNIDKRRGFSRFQSDEHIRQIKLNATPNIVVVSGYRGQRIGALEDYQIRQIMTLSFASQALTPTEELSLTDQINEAIQRAEQIMFDFIHRIEVDASESDCGPLQYIEIERIAWDEIYDQPIIDNYYGWELTLPFKSILPGYDPQRWEDPNLLSDEGMAIQTDNEENLNG